MGQLALPTSGLVYLDASPIIYSVEKISPYQEIMHPLWAAAQSGSFGLLGSELLLLEILVKPLQNQDRILEATFRQLLTASRELQLVPITASVLERATQLRATVGVKTPDAIHAATALIYGCTLFVTNDPGFRRIAGLKIAVLQDLIKGAGRDLSNR